MKYKKLLKKARQITNNLSEEYGATFTIDIYVTDKNELHIGFLHVEESFHRDYPAEKASLDLLQEGLERYLLCRSLAHATNFSYNHFFHNFELHELIEIYYFLDRVANKGVK